MNPFTCSIDKCPRNPRDYPPLPMPERFRLWCKRIERNTRRFKKRPHHLLLRQCFVGFFQLPDNRVSIDSLGRLLHASRSEPLAQIDVA